MEREMEEIGRKIEFQKFRVQNDQHIFILSLAASRIRNNVSRNRCLQSVMVVVLREFTANQVCNLRYANILPFGDYARVGMYISFPFLVSSAPTFFIFIFYFRSRSCWCALIIENSRRRLTLS